MDEILTPPTSVPTPPASPVDPTSKPKNHAVRWIVAGAVILVIGVGMSLAIGKYSPKRIISYEDCLKAKGSRVQESNPPTCVTANGLRFKGPVASPTLTPDPTTNWKTYTNEPVGLSFKYPPAFSLKISDKGLYFVDVTGLFQTNISWNKSTSSLEEEIKGRDLCPKEVTSGIVVGPIANSLRCDFIKSHYASVDIWIMNGNNLYKATIGAINPNTPIPVESITLLNQILFTFKFLDQTTPTPKPTCKPRPACLDATPRCMIPETSDMCPPNQKL